MKVFDGYQDIQMVRAINKTEDAKGTSKPRKKVISTFGIREGNRDITIAFVVTHPRRDTRHGVIGATAPMSKYGKSLLESMFGKW